MPPLPYTPPSEPFLDILFVDDHILVANKQSGLLSVPGKADHMQDCLETRVQCHYPTARPAHRLDMDTSGVLIFALSLDALRHLGRQFEKRETEKTYIAVIDGIPCKPSGMIDLPLICDWPNRPKQIIDHKIGKEAITHYEVLQHNNQRATVRLRPITGRSHQLRVHMQALGHPIIGDRFYCNVGHDLVANSRLLLHANMLSLRHPALNTKMTFEAPVPF